MSDSVKYLSIDSIESKDQQEKIKCQTNKAIYNQKCKKIKLPYA